jgi:hypothetical protein
VSEHPIPPDVIAVARVAYENGNFSGNVARMEAAIRAADEKRGLRVEARRVSLDGGEHFVRETRVIGDWIADAEDPADVHMRTVKDREVDSGACDE